MAWLLSFLAGMWNVVAGIGVVAGILAFGFQVQSWIVDRRRMSSGRLDLVFAPGGMIEHDGERKPFAVLRVMNVGASPIRILRIGISGFTVPAEQSNDPFGGNELLSPGDVYRVGCMDCGPDACMYVEYVDHADRRFMFVQYIEVTSSAYAFTGVSWRKIRKAYKPLTVRPGSAEDVPLGPAHPGMLRIRLGRRRSREWLRVVEEALARASTRGCLDMSPRLPQGVRSNRSR
ncbi:hypothetical protein [Bifidobacterium sp. SO1]|nr:hypothetical protein [Bifidobacterium sp. SO1]MBT1162698.1 hypothetical protein [Bifidobacterium sp. SO1]